MQHALNDFLANDLPNYLYLIGIWDRNTQLRMGAVGILLGILLYTISNVGYGVMAKYFYS